MGWSGIKTTDSEYPVCISSLMLKNVLLRVFGSSGLATLTTLPTLVHMQPPLWWTEWHGILSIPGSGGQGHAPSLGFLSVGQCSPPQDTGCRCTSHSPHHSSCLSTSAFTGLVSSIMCLLWLCPLLSLSFSTSPALTQTPESLLHFCEHASSFSHNSGTLWEQL